MVTANQSNSNRIQGILLCQFHPDEGPKIVYQHPADHVTSETFKLLQTYLCPKEELTQKLITVRAFNHKILGCPIYINNKRLYKRNNFIFNVCFIFHPQTKTSSYEPILKKLTDTLAVVETESGYLSLASGREVYYVEPDSQFSFPNKQFITSVHQLLFQVMEDLNTKTCATIPIDDANTINLKLVDSNIVPGDVRDHHVPVLLFTPNHYVEHEWDLATRQIIPYIDGVKHVARISQEANINIRLLRTVIKNLMFVKLVTITPIFQFSNVYKITPEIQTLYNSKDLQNQCMKSVSLKQNSLPQFDDIMKIYFSFTYSSMTTAKLVCTRHRPDKLNIDIRKLIQFGVIHRFLKRIQKYPVRTYPTSESAGREVIRYCDGFNSYDEICCALGLSYAELDAQIEEDPNIVVCWK